MKLEVPGLDHAGFAQAERLVPCSKNFQSFEHEIRTGHIEPIVPAGFDVQTAHAALAKVNIHGIGRGILDR